MSNIKKIQIGENIYDIDAKSVDGHSVEETGIASNTTTIPTTAQVKTYVDDNFDTEDWTFTVVNNGTTSTVTKRVYIKTITS